MNSDAKDSAKIVRFNRPAVLVAIGLVVVVALIASFLAGRFVDAPARDEILDASSSIQVTAEVEQRVVDARTSFAGQMQAGGNTGLNPSVLPEQAVVTRQQLSAGSTIDRGSLLGAIAGVPVFVLAGPLPLYRDLQLGDQGDDVRALQQALIDAGYLARVTGNVDNGTLAAVARLFDTADFSLPTQAGADQDPAAHSAPGYIPFSSFVASPVLPATVIGATPVGELVGADHALVTIQTTSPAVVFRIDATAPDTIAPGAQVTVQWEGSSFDGTIAAIGDFTDGSDGRVPGRDVRVDVDPAALDVVAIGSSVTILDQAPSAESMAVPLVAIRHDSTGDYVVRVGSDGETENVQVEVGVTGGGWAAVESDALAVGNRVVVS